VKQSSREYLKNTILNILEEVMFSKHNECCVRTVGYKSTQILKHTMESFVVYNNFTHKHSTMSANRAYDCYIVLTFEYNSFLAIVYNII